VNAKIKRVLAASLCLVFVLILANCTVTTNDQYFWGSYENLLYDMYIKPGSVPPPLQIDKLEVDISKATNKGKAIPPGVFAHLGMMYAANGDIANATRAFNKEKTLYPESQVLIDGMLERASRNVK